MLAGEGYDTYASDSDLDRDGSDCWAENGSTEGHIFVTVKHHFLTGRNRNQCEKMLCMYLLTACYQTRV